MRTFSHGFEIIRPTTMLSSLAALAIALASPAHGQAFQGTPTTTYGRVGYDRGTPGTETITVGSSQAVIDWGAGGTSGGTVDFLPAGNRAIFTNDPSKTANFTVLNRITTASGAGISLNGAIVSQLQDAAGNVSRGGSVWFYSAGGIIVGANATIDVGALGLTTDKPYVNTTGDFNSGGRVHFLGPAGNLSPVTIAQGAKINALGDNGYVIVVAPRITQAGDVRANGGVAYVAAEMVDMRIHQGLFDIEVTAGTSAKGQVLTHSGSSGGPAGTANDRGIYLVAVPKNDAITMLVADGSALGFDLATGAAVDNGVVVLSGGHDVEGGKIVVAPLTKVAADIKIRSSSFTSTLSGWSTDTLDIGGGDLSFSTDVDLRAAKLVQLTASAADKVTVGGNLSLIADDIATGSADATAGDAFVSIGGTAKMTVAGDLLVSAVAKGGSYTQGASRVGFGVGGRARLTVDGGSISVAGGATLASDGSAGTVSRPGLDSEIGGSGATTVDAHNKGAIDIAGNLVMTGVGTGGPNRGGGRGAGGQGTGGNLQIVADSGASIKVSESVTLDSRGIGGEAKGGVRGGFGSGGQTRIEADNAMITILGSASLNAVGTGGKGPTGGGGSGGLADIVGSAGGKVTVTSALVMDASGTGGSFGEGGIAGGTGSGGMTTMTAAGGAISVGGDAFLRADGTGGASGVGGVGRGRTVAVSALGGSIDIGNALTASANGVGGAGATGGAGGKASGGTIDLIAGQQSESVGDPGRLSAGGIELGANALGGAGGIGTGGATGGVGGAGGAAAGGAITVGSSGGLLKTGLLVANTIATGGVGGGGGRNSDGRGGDGGVGGNAVGGSVQVYAGLTKSKDASANGTSVGATSLRADATGGDGGTLGNGSGGRGDGGNGGNATGGTVALAAISSRLSTDSASLITGGFGGNGGAGKTLGNGGTGQAGSFGILVAADGSGIAGAGTIGTLTGAADAGGGNGAIGGTGTSGSFALQVTGGKLTIAEATLSADGRVAGRQSTLAVSDDGRIAVAKDFSSTTAADLAITVSGGSIGARGIMTLTSAGRITDDAGDDASLKPGSITAATLAIAADRGVNLGSTLGVGTATIGSTGGTIDLGVVEATRDITLTAARDVNAASLSAGGSIDATATRNISVAEADAGLNDTGDQPDRAAGATFKAGARLTLGNVGALDAIELSAQGGIKTGDLAAGRLVQVRGGGDVALGAVTASGSSSGGTVLVDASAGGALSLDQITSDGNIVLTATGNLSSGASANAGAGFVASGANVTLGSVSAQTIFANTQGLLAVRGAVEAPQITISSGDLEIRSTPDVEAVIGQSDTALFINAVAPGKQVVFGGDGRGNDGGYTIDASEVAQLRAHNMVFASVNDGGAAQGVLLVKDFIVDGTLSGRAGLYGDAAALTLVAPSIRVEGAGLIRNSGATDTLSLVTADGRIAIATDLGGSLAVVSGKDASTPVTGQISLIGADIAVATSAVLAKLEKDTNYAGRDADLAATPSRANAAGFLQAGGITVGTGHSFFVQNSGTSSVDGGFTFGAGGMTVFATPQERDGTVPAVDVVIYGRGRADDGSFVTNGDAVKLVRFQATPQSGGFSAASSVNGCVINKTCSDVVTPPPPPPPPPDNQPPPVVDVAQGTVGTDVLGVIEGASSTATGEATVVPSVNITQLVDVAAFSTEASVDEPVTGGGNPSFWSVQPGDGDEDDVVPATPAKGATK